MTTSKEQTMDEIAWHKPAHRAVMASAKLGPWMSAALDDPMVCDAMKADIREWFSAGEPMETLGQALTAARATIAQQGEELARMREALEPSGATKAAYMGEFAFDLFRGVSDAGVDQYEKVYVPWDTVKQIMAAIAKRAALEGPKQ